MRSAMSLVVALCMAGAMTGCGSVVDIEGDLGGNDAHAGNTGEACSTGSTCSTGLCVDGYCCDTKCDGVCEACNVASMKGTCSPVPANTDPAMECNPVLTASGDMAVMGDGGTEINLPDGGVDVTAATCAGSCNGSRACEYPGQTTSCGPGFCNTDVEVARPVCDNQGHCTIQPFACDGYTCGPNDCKTTCTANTDCDDNSYCDSGKCATKEQPGTTCTSFEECASGYCDNGICCSSDCGAVLGGNCGNKQGQCECQVAGVTCTQGCKPYYQDVDGDGFGDPKSTPVAGCGDTPPPPNGAIVYVADNTDCYDASPAAHPNAAFAHPGSTYYGTTDRGDGSYDYNCDGTESHFYVERPAGSVCGVCTAPITHVTKGGTSRLCFGPNASYCATDTGTDQRDLICPLAYDSQNATYNCDGFSGFYVACFIGEYCPGNDEGFTNTINCGATAGYQYCGHCTGSGGITGESSVPTTQKCN